MSPVSPVLPDPPTGHPRAMVLLEHLTPDGGRHLDWLVDRSASAPLTSFRLPRWPQAGTEVPLELAEDHDRRWLHDEGDVSGGRGQATRIARGLLLSVERQDARWLLSLSWTPSDAGQSEGVQSVSLSGVDGGWVLARLAR